MSIPVVDLFAGPGGLGEGFSSVRTGAGEPVFKIALSIEMDRAAHKTFELRSFFRQFPRAGVPEDYYRFLRQEISREELFARHPAEAGSAQEDAWNAELGKQPPADVDERIVRAIGGSPVWMLCGGPPCQAYSVMGRSRSGGIDENDHRLYLYREYLRILAVHRPTALVFENVKGILSSKVKGSALFHPLLADLRSPTTAFGGHRAPIRYCIYSLTVPGQACCVDGEPLFDYRDFVIRSEEHDIPQARHRVILLGVREDMAPLVVPTLAKKNRHVPVGRVLSGLPRLRSGVTRRKDDRRNGRGRYTKWSAVTRFQESRMARRLAPAKRSGEPFYE
ncbi:MAG: DNA cytosine methyltransferase [Acidobacteriota bacterium]|nr:DNA cytosine methyltransferase [Acidobacteriota bacterium]